LSPKLLRFAADGGLCQLRAGHAPFQTERLSSENDNDMLCAVCTVESYLGGDFVIRQRSGHFSIHAGAVNSHGRGSFSGDDELCEVAVEGSDVAYEPALRRIVADALDDCVCGEEKGHIGGAEA